MQLLLSHLVSPRSRRFFRSRTHVILGTFLCLCLSLFLYQKFSNHYRILYDLQVGPTCLPWDWFLVQTTLETPTRGDLYQFQSHGLLRPFFLDDQHAVKIVAAVPGDHIRIEGVEAGRTYINGKPWPTTLTVVELFPEDSPTAYAFDGIVPPDHYFMLGSLPNSFDSRYYGFVPKSHLLGKAYAIY